LRIVPKKGLASRERQSSYLQN